MYGRMRDALRWGLPTLVLRFCICISNCEHTCIWLDDFTIRRRDEACSCTASTESSNSIKEADSGVGKGDGAAVAVDVPGSVTGAVGAFHARKAYYRRYNRDRKG